jgi:hypothetical protein
MIEYKPQPVGGGAPVVRLALLVALCLFIVAGAAVVFGATPTSTNGSPAGAAADASAAPTADATAPAASNEPGNPKAGGPFFRGPGRMGVGLGGPMKGWVCAHDGGRCSAFGENSPLQITIAAIDGSSLSLKTNDGWTRTIDASGATITRGGQTISVGDLSVGDAIALNEQRNADGTFKVTAIAVIEPEVSGTVQDVTSAGFTVKQEDGSTQAVTTTDKTTYSLGKQSADRSAVKAGVQVDVEGTKSGTTFTATDVRIAPSTLVGQVTKVGADSITITQRDGSSATIKVNAKTAYKVAGSTNPTLADIKVGDDVLAQGTLNSDGSLDATIVAAGNMTFREGGPGKFGGRGFGGSRGHGPGGFGGFGGFGPFGNSGPGNSNSGPQASPGSDSSS